MRLSFDDGPGPSTMALLDVLRRASCKATFFVLGQNLERAPDVGARIVREGHRLGNHTWSHARPGMLSQAALIDEIHATDALIRQAWRDAGFEAPACIPLRLPYGVDRSGADGTAADERLVVLSRLRRSHSGWTAIFDDWRDPAPSPRDLYQAMRQHIGEQARRGQRAVLCLHDSSRHAHARPSTVEAVRLLLDVPDALGVQQMAQATQEAHAGPGRP